MRAIDKYQEGQTVRVFQKKGEFRGFPHFNNPMTVTEKVYTNNTVHCFDNFGNEVSFKLDDWRLLVDVGQTNKAI